MIRSRAVGPTFEKLGEATQLSFFSGSGGLIARRQRQFNGVPLSLEGGSVVGRFRLSGPRLGTRTTPGELPANRARVI